MRILRGSRPCSPASSADFFAKEAKCSRHPPFLLCARSGRLPSVPFAVQTATWTSRAEDIRKRPRSQGQETTVSGSRDRGLRVKRPRSPGQETTVSGSRDRGLRSKRPRSFDRETARGTGRALVRPQASPSSHVATSPDPSGRAAAFRGVLGGMRRNPRPRAGGARLLLRTDAKNGILLSVHGSP